MLMFKLYLKSNFEHEQPTWACPTSRISQEIQSLARIISNVTLITRLCDFEQVNEGIFIVWKFIAFDGFKKRRKVVVAEYYGGVFFVKGKGGRVGWTQGTKDHEAG